MQPVVTDRVAWSVSQSVTVVSPAKTTEPIKNAVWAQATTYYVRSRSPMEIDNFEGGKGWPIAKYRYYRLN